MPTHDTIARIKAIADDPRGDPKFARWRAWPLSLPETPNLISFV